VNAEYYSPDAVFSGPGRAGWDVLPVADSGASGGIIERLEGRQCAAVAASFSLLGNRNWLNLFD
jgi:hypothetical protein